MFKKVMLEERKRGATILIVSLVMDDIMQICDEQLILVDKKLKNINNKSGEAENV